MSMEILIFEILFGYTLQAFSFVLGVYAFCGVKFEKRKYTIASLILVGTSYLFRLLPISFGVHTLLNILILFIISLQYLKTPINKSLLATLLVTIILVANEMVNVVLMISYFGQAQFEVFMEDPVQKAILGLPASVTFAAAIFIIYKILNKKRKLKSVG